MPILKFLLRYMITVLIALDQLVNTLFLGDPDETISSRSFRCKSNALWNLTHSIIDLIFFFDKVITPDGRVIRHCELSFLMYIKRRQSTALKYGEDAKHLLTEIKNVTPHF